MPWSCDREGRVVCLRCNKIPMRLIYQTTKDDDHHLTMQCRGCSDLITIRVKLHPDVKPERQHGIEEAVPKREPVG